MRPSLTPVVALATLLAAFPTSLRSARADDDDHHHERPAAKGGTIVDVAKKAGSFKTLLKALEVTGLDAALAGRGPFTVFAPTDEAFARLPEGTLEQLLADKDKLAAILKYHVARTAKRASEVVLFDSAGTLEGSRLSIAVRDGKVKIDEATVVTADVIASNGVIHVIDRVLIPHTDAGTIVGVARSTGRFKKLLAALEATGLDRALAGEGPFTVFAPTDEAFAALPEGALEALLADRDALTRVLKNHVVSGRVLAADVVRLDSAKTLAGTCLSIDARDGVKVDGARVVKADVKATNGVIHVIDHVLVPAPVAKFPSLKAKSLARKEVELPGGLKGEKNLCLIAFEQWQQRDVDTWLGWLADSSLADAEGFAYYELPTINRMGATRERLLDEGMRAGIPDKAARARTITLYTDKKAFQKALGIDGDDSIHAILIDRDGNVLWRAAGRFTEEKGRALVEAFRR